MNRCAEIGDTIGEFDPAHGHYRTKDILLDIYDVLQRAITTGEPYQTRLDPPPADPRCCNLPNENANGKEN